MTDAEVEIAELDAPGVLRHLDDLCRVLIDCVADGAAVSFMAPLSPAAAETFWAVDVAAAVAGGDRHLFGAFVDGRLVGTVQLFVGLPPNQPHRAEISKMIVHPEVRRRGIGAALLQAAFAVARRSGKTLVTLDTRTGDVSERLYRSVGFEPAGVIPGFALDPDGAALHATTYMYKRL
ncbi:MAG: GNAT family N-acetyltransferase [Maritimibacter sp.]|nr:GNAT family N-acetyltransferase [Maritimibacter sp.]